MCLSARYVCDRYAGKSSLLLRYTQNEFNVEYMPTIGIDFRLKTVEVNGKTVKVQVWVRTRNSTHAAQGDKWKQAAHR